MGNCHAKKRDAVVIKVKQEGDGVFHYDKDAKRIVYAGEDARTELMLASSGSGSECSRKPSGSNTGDKDGNKAKKKSVLGEIAEFTEYLEDDSSTIYTQTTYGRNHTEYLEDDTSTIYTQRRNQNDYLEDDTSTIFTQTTCGRNHSPVSFLSPPQPPQHRQKATYETLSPEDHDISTIYTQTTYERNHSPVSFFSPLPPQLQQTSSNETLSTSFTDPAYIHREWMDERLEI